MLLDVNIRWWQIMGKVRKESWGWLPQTPNDKLMKEAVYWMKCNNTSPITTYCRKGQHQSQIQNWLWNSGTLVFMYCWFINGSIIKGSLVKGWAFQRNMKLIQRTQKLFKIYFFSWLDHRLAEKSTS